MVDWIPRNYPQIRQKEEEEKRFDWLKNLPKIPWEAKIFGPLGYAIKYGAPALMKGMEQLGTMFGATATMPFREQEGWKRAAAGVPPIGLAMNWPGTKRYQEYKDWKGSKEEPQIPLGFESPFKEGMATIGVGDVSELAVWSALPAGGATKVAKAGEMLTTKTGGLTPKLASRLLATREAAKAKAIVLKVKPSGDVISISELSSQISKVQEKLPTLLSKIERSKLTDRELTKYLQKQVTEEIAFDPTIRLYRGVKKGAVDPKKFWGVSKQFADDFAGKEGKVSFVDVKISELINPELVFQASLKDMNDIMLKPILSSRGKPIEALARAVGKGVSTKAGKVPPEIAPIDDFDPVIRKLEGGVKYALQVQKETRALTKVQLGKKAGKLGEVYREGKGIETYYKGQTTLKGKLEKAEFKVPKEFQFTTDDTDKILNMVYTKRLRSFEKGRASTAIMKLSGLVKDESGKVAQLQLNEIKLLSQAFPELRPILRLYKSVGQGNWGYVADALNIPRATLSSGDMSITFRQLLPALARKPQHLPGVMKTQLRVVFSSKNFKHIDDAMTADKDVGMFLDEGLFWAEQPGKVGVELTKREEQYASGLAERIPILGQWIKASERAFHGGGNYMRAQMAKDYARMLRKSNSLTTENVKGLVPFINASTGRGSFPQKIEAIAPFMNAMLFSPRFIISKLQLPVMMFSKNPIVRKEAIRTMVQLLSLGASTLGMASVAGAKVEMNPLSSDFGKIRVNNTRLDIWTGYVQWARFIAQMIMDERKTTATGKMQDLKRLETIWRFLQSKGSPIFSLFVDMAAEQNYMGEPMFKGGVETFKRELRNRLTPLFVQDLWDALETEGLIGGLYASPGFLGVGVTSYKDKKSRYSGIEDLPSLPKLKSLPGGTQPGGELKPPDLPPLPKLKSAK